MKPLPFLSLWLSLLAVGCTGRPALEYTQNGAYSQGTPAVYEPEREPRPGRLPAPGMIRTADHFSAPDVQADSLQNLVQRHYQERDLALNYVDRRAFWRRVQSRLPSYRQWFVEAGEETGIDWRLLAAIGYQESHWNENAVSPTGVRGLMMLTRDAARAAGVTERTDPEQSIRGGARYLQIIDRKIPPRIQGEDRLWLTLAGYNIGFGHLEDARILTQRQGGDPDRWEDVKRRLPLLSQQPYYSTLKHGYARGREPVTFVENIRFFYELLVWWDEQPEVATTPAGI